MSSSYMKENSKMSPLTLATSTTTTTTTTTPPALQQNEKTFNANGLLLDATKLKTDLSLATSLRATQSSDKQPLKVRFLIFVEDADGSRFNIFDSAKSTPTSTTTKSTQQISIGNSAANASNSAQSNTTTTTSTNAKSASSATSPISSKLNNEMLTRMVFGSFPMVVSNRTAIKVHSLK